MRIITTDLQNCFLGCDNNIDLDLPNLWDLGFIILPIVPNENHSLINVNYDITVVGYIDGVLSTKSHSHNYNGNIKIEKNANNKYKFSFDSVIWDSINSVSISTIAKQITDEYLTIIDNSTGFTFFDSAKVVPKKTSCFIYCYTPGTITENPTVTIGTTTRPSSLAKTVINNNIVTFAYVVIPYTIIGTNQNATINGKANVETLPIILDSEHIEFTENSVTKINNIDSKYYIEIKIKKGFTFVKTPKIKARFYSQSSGNFNVISQLMALKSGTTDTYFINYTPTIYSDQTEQEFFDANKNYNMPTTETEIISENPLISDFGCINVYKTNTVINKNLVNKRFFNIETNKYEDLGNYILSFIKYPFDIETSEEKNIIYGWFDTKIKSPLVNNQIINLSLGKIILNGYYKNSSDINNTRIKLLLPYADIYELDSIYINTTIEVKYKIDILSNTCVIEIFSNDTLIDTINTSIGYNIPYILKTDVISPNINLQSNVLKNTKAQIIIFQKLKVNNTHYETVVNKKISETTGFIKCNTVELVISKNMTVYEQQEIDSLLKNGIII